MNYISFFFIYFIIIKNVFNKSSSLEISFKKETFNINNDFIANDIIRHATKIEKPKSEYKVMPMMTNSSSGGVGFNDIFKRRYIKK
jgi:hypothetical protein